MFSIFTSILGIITGMSMFSFHKKTDTKYWLGLSAAILLAHFVVGLLIVMLLNLNFVNHTLTPVFQYLGLFKLTWPEQPLGSLHFLATKSILVFSHYDARSALNLWTLEYDFYTLVVYIVVSLSLGRIMANQRNSSSKLPRNILLSFVVAGFLVSFSMSYMTVLEHCSGATWVGFVTLYGIGLNEFQLFPIYQVICALIGILGFISLLMRVSAIKSRSFS